jgi:hypothetical protein
MALAAAASIVWLSVCASPPAGAVLSRTSEDMAGARLALAISPDRPDCPTLALPVGDARVLWLGFEPASSTGSPVIRLIGPVPGRPDGPVAVSEIEFDDGAANSVPMLPVGPDLLDQAKPHALGRAVLGKAGSGAITARCAAGTAAGEVVVDLPGHLPRGARLILAAEYDADAPFEVTLGGETSLGRLPPGSGRQGDVPLPGSGAGNAAVSATLRCPSTAAWISLRSLRLRQGDGRPVPLSTWVWRPAQWREDEDGLITAARARGLGRIFIGLDIQDGAVADAGRLRSFLQAARAAGLSVWAVEGDPAAITKAGRPAFLQRTRAIAAFNRGSPALDGIQYDIEPYLLAGWPLNRAAGIAAYLDTLEQLKRAAAGPVEAVLPFWWFDMPEMAGSLDRLAAAADRFAVMAYRTAPDGIVAAAESALAWAGAHDRPMTVALEAGPLPDDRVQSFRPAAEGELWRVTLDGRRILILLDRPRASPVGQAYRRRGDHRLPAGRLSFLGDTAALAAAIDSIRSVLSAWPAFAGIAVHGLLDGPLEEL